MTNTAYQHLAVCYDLLMDVDYQQWSKYLLQFITTKPTDTALLDVGCGTGALSNIFAQLGFKVVGVDSSPAMLNIAWQHLQPNMQFLQQNIVDLNLQQHYNVIISTCDVFNYLTTENELHSALQSIKQHLAPEGLFLFDISSQYKLQNLLGNNNFAEVSDDVSYIWDNYYDEQSSLLTMKLTFFMPYENTGLYYRGSEEHVQRGWSIAEIKAALIATDFHNITEYNAFTLDSPTESSERIQFVAYLK